MRNIVMQGLSADNYVTPRAVSYLIVNIQHNYHSYVYLTCPNWSYISASIISKYTFNNSLSKLKLMD